MHLGLFSLMPYRDRNQPLESVFTQTADQVNLAEDIGFDIAWFAEHHFSNYSLCPSPIGMATYMAARTKRIRLGTGVIVVPLYHPLRVLEDLCLLDLVSDGRAVIGLGSGYQQYEFHKFGVDLASGRDTFLEVLDVFEQFFKNGAVALDGKHISIPHTDFSLRFKQKRPDIYVAGLGSDPETQARIVKGGYIPIFTAGWNNLQGLKAVRDKVSEGYVASGGTSDTMPFAMQQYVYVTRDKKEAREAAEAARYIRRVASSMRANTARLDGVFLQDDPTPNEPSLEDLAQQLVIGDPETVAEKLNAQFDVLKPTHWSLFMALPGVEHAKTMRSIELFGSEVMPLIAHHLTPNAPTLAKTA
jgi:alkanesulfonate monooxygenase SsuD/methylene tetrahydromethanopterin reductase-like flavin-dependent oxidoreductase (luciferase family)